MDRCSHLCLLLALILLGGCGKPQQPAAVVAMPKQAVDAPVTRIVPTESENSIPVAQTEMVATAAEGTAEATFQKTLIAFQQGRLDAAFDFLPETYQADVQGLVHEFAEKMDAEVWSATFDLLAKVANILKTKKSLILSLDLVKKSPQFGTIEPHWDAFTAGIHEVATSETVSLANLKKCDVRDLLASTSRLLNGLPLPKFGDVVVTTTKSDADHATLSFRDSPNAEPKTVEFVKVDGKWLPKSIADGWNEGIASAKARLASLPDLIATFRPVAMDRLKTFEGMLEPLQQAKSAEDFTRALAPLAFNLMLTFSGVEQAINELGTTSRKGDAVRGVVNRELSDSEQTKLKEAVVAAVDGEDLVYEMIPGDGKTRFRFTPIPNRDVIVTLLQKHFAGATVSVDDETKLIHVELK